MDLWLWKHDLLWRGANLMNISPSWNTLEISGLLFTKGPLG